MAASFAADDVTITVYQASNETETKFSGPSLSVKKNLRVMMHQMISIELNISSDEVEEYFRPDSDDDHTALRPEVDFLSGPFKRKRNELNNVKSLRRSSAILTRNSPRKRSRMRLPSPTNSPSK